MVSNEGIPVEIDWHAMKLGCSFFIPMLDTDNVIPQILSEAKKRKFKLVHKELVENGMFGVRFWRIR